MPTATIVAKYVNDPMQGKKNGTIKTPEGVYYGIPADWVKQFTAGASYDVEYKENAFQGKTYKNITKFAMSQAAPPANSGQASVAGGTNSGYGGAKYGSTDMATAERIYVCGALNAAISSGRLELVTTDIIEATQTLRAAWSQTFGRVKTPLQEATGDEIPY